VTMSKNMHMESKAPWVEIWDGIERSG
jgi:hypothetical protein